MYYFNKEPFVTTKRLIIHCALADISPLEGNLWCRQSIDSFKRYITTTNKQGIILYVQYQKENIFYVDLFIKNLDFFSSDSSDSMNYISLNLADQMVKDGIARRPWHCEAKGTSLSFTSQDGSSQMELATHETNGHGHSIEVDEKVERSEAEDEDEPEPNIDKKLLYLNSLDIGVFKIKNGVICKRYIYPSRNNAVSYETRVCHYGKCSIIIHSSPFRKEQIKNFNNKVYCSKHLKILKLQTLNKSNTNALCLTHGCNKYRHANSQNGQASKYCINCVKALTIPTIYKTIESNESFSFVNGFLNIYCKEINCKTLIQKGHYCHIHMVNKNNIRDVIADRHYPIQENPREIVRHW